MWYVFFLFFFFFSSRRRHTSSLRDWSSDVCSSDLTAANRPQGGRGADSLLKMFRVSSLRSEERRVGKSVDLGGRRIIKKKKENKEVKEHKSEGPSGWMQIISKQEKPE